MKRILFWILCIITIMFAVRIAKILIKDLDKLTQFGYGYLTGQVVLFAIFLVGSVVLGMSMARKKSKNRHASS